MNANSKQTSLQLVRALRILFTVAVLSFILIFLFVLLYDLLGMSESSLLRNCCCSHTPLYKLRSIHVIINSSTKIQLL